MLYNFVMEDNIVQEEEEDDTITEMSEISDDFSELFAEFGLTRGQQRQLERAFSIVSKEAEQGTKLVAAVHLMGISVTDWVVQAACWRNIDQFEFNLRNSLTWEIRMLPVKKSARPTGFIESMLANVTFFITVLMTNGISPKDGDVVWLTETEFMRQIPCAAFRKKPKNPVAVVTFKAK